MNVQYLSDRKGRRTGVYIPIKEWEKMKKRYDLPIEEDEPALTKAGLIADVKEALEEVKLYKQGKVQLQTLDDFLNEF